MFQLKQVFLFILIVFMIKLTIAV
ncbi:unnamed protein product, partial [Rotaria sordida]